MLIRTFSRRIQPASTSAAKVWGVSRADIMKVADWSRESTFTRFCCKPVNSGVFGATILDQVIILWTIHCHICSLATTWNPLGSEVRLEFHELQGKYMTAHPQQRMWSSCYWSHPLIFSHITIVRRGWACKVKTNFSRKAQSILPHARNKGI